MHSAKSGNSCSILLKLDGCNSTNLECVALRIEGTWEIVDKPGLYVDPINLSSLLVL